MHSTTTTTCLPVCVCVCVCDDHLHDHNTTKHEPLNFRPLELTPNNLTTPTHLAIDVTFYKITFMGMKLAGVLLLMIGFLVCLLPENWNEFLYDLVNERFIRWKKKRSLKKSRNKVQDLSTGQTSRLRTPSGRVK